jgi:hypothetical protein
LAGALGLRVAVVASFQAVHQQCLLAAAQRDAAGVLVGLEITALCPLRKLDRALQRRSPLGDL